MGNQLIHGRKVITQKFSCTREENLNSCKFYGNG